MLIACDFGDAVHCYVETRGIRKITSRSCTRRVLSTRCCSTEELMKQYKTNKRYRIQHYNYRRRRRRRSIVLRDRQRKKKGRVNYGFPAGERSLTNRVGSGRIGSAWLMGWSDDDMSYYYHRSRMQPARNNKYATLAQSFHYMISVKWYRLFIVITYTV